ncbi:hypothetical protein MJA45_15840 [Paenibacillus aurantius]|uniref:Uncharacterized protein n=1 Tax=Paenibacillus aurantius TaxID=2918900 RepID=A0AA96RDH8_9BACL|nr:hypothetical protein [Paenibacillus aurantius]WJH34046.1 hypothetical protein N6H14_29465 [Paenibacillus sp. CC-CFT747]WNQ09118.1 hypothetical protein MJA45_15840 [Paenibacillus aurantius]
MTESKTPDNMEGEPKKISLAEAVRNKLAQKKQAQQNDSSNPQRAGNMKAKSQMTKKVNNQRRRTGGS